MNSAPWTEIGRCQQDISSIKSELHRKADSYEIHEINRKLDNLEHTLRNISSSFDGLLSRLEACEGQIAQLSKEEIGPGAKFCKICGMALMADKGAE